MDGLIRIREAVAVEGRYDKNTLSQVVDTLILETGGFQIFKDPDRMALLRETDVLVDGPFLLAQRSLELKYCGSRNQRLIDVKKTLSSGVPTLWEPPVW